jgi:hypothetical protein
MLTEYKSIVTDILNGYEDTNLGNYLGSSARTVGMHPDIHCRYPHPGN